MLVWTTIGTERRIEMNKPRRKELNKTLDLLAQARAIIEAMQEEEQESFDNMPEGLQMSELGERIEENANRLAEIMDALEEQYDELEDVING